MKRSVVKEPGEGSKIPPADAGDAKLKKKKSALPTVLLIVAFVVGLSVFLYPSVSDYLNRRGAATVLSDYDSTVASGGLNYEALFGDAESYNSALANRGMAHYINGSPRDDVYSSLLDVTGDGMIGYLDISKIGVSLPIYHGTSGEVLDKAVGHLEGSSLPVGGESTHSVLTGHRGLPTASLFTDLDMLQVGDTFTITVLNRTLTYMVDEIRVVLPEEASTISIVDGEDYVTLVTCTPYAVNTHRLLVRGTRVTNVSTATVLADAIRLDPLLVAPFIAVPALVLIMFISLGATSRTGRARRERLRAAREELNAAAKGG